jgi:hypothetical protein
MTDKLKPIQVPDVPTKLWNEFAGESKKRGMKITVALQEAITEWLKK